VLAVVIVLFVVSLAAGCYFGHTLPREDLAEWARREEYIDKRVGETEPWASARSMGWLRSRFGAEYDEIRNAGWDEGFEAGKLSGAVPTGLGLERLRDRIRSFPAPEAGRPARVSQPPR
jgi:flagellar biosynthesis/type III secretory pathway protein FliH